MEERIKWLHWIFFYSDSANRRLAPGIKTMLHSQSSLDIALQCRLCRHVCLSRIHAHAQTHAKKTQGDRVRMVQRRQLSIGQVQLLWVWDICKDDRKWRAYTQIQTQNAQTHFLRSCTMIRTERAMAGTMKPAMIASVALTTQWKKHVSEHQLMSPMSSRMRRAPNHELWDPFCTYQEEVDLFLRFVSFSTSRQGSKMIIAWFSLLCSSPGRNRKESVFLFCFTVSCCLAGFFFLNFLFLVFDFRLTIYSVPSPLSWSFLLFLFFFSFLSSFFSLAIHTSSCKTTCCLVIGQFQLRQTVSLHSPANDLLNFTDIFPFKKSTTNLKWDIARREQSGVGSRATAKVPNYPPPKSGFSLGIIMPSSEENDFPRWMPECIAHT